MQIKVYIFEKPYQRSFFPFHAGDRAGTLAIVTLKGLTRQEHYLGQTEAL